MFTDWLSDQMQKRFWTQAVLAREAGISKGSLSHLFSGTRKPGASLLKAIARALSVPADEVFRAAGVIESNPVPEKLPGLAEWTQLYIDADDDVRQEILDKARYITGRAARRRKRDQELK